MSNCSHEAWDFGALQCPDCGAVKGHVADADYAKLEAEAQALREEVERSEQHRNDQADLIVSLRTEVAALKHSQQVLIGSRNAHRDERDAARKEVAALRARVVVVPDPVTMDGTTTIREYVANAVPKDTPMDKWTQGYEECKRRIHAMFEQPCNKRPNGLTVSEGLLRRIVTPALTSSDAQDRIGALEELRALLSE
ncbi:hypothetical protein R5H17_010640 [Pseudomonas aeruginosa]|jgi:hypothetical protein|uniref:hypothetical protein n=1 Tax=Pseudomonas aeruginosa TaxID=287 RepID=UPI00071BA727|nr:hypothetical protein [Pseudomonas aeruginosa]KSE59401.1 hypothetical protein AO927_22330 [Pseudomonas aeruginosa]MDW2962931.1 hypothetical protein [Pseudomonas aeruginosa]HBO2146480.1 hypothetical protein [Pseudomonas aeruginosa]HEP8118109.1 hypothetical protein [Pseudomonas aeruginosa]HEP9276313.1 hypothetical protein [Pseudomonas aeruginosa]